MPCRSTIAPSSTCSSGPRSSRRRQRRDREARARHYLPPLIERERATSFFAPPTVWIAMLRAPRFDSGGSVEPAQGLLRRLDHAGRGHARDGAADAEGPALEPLRPDRDRPARHHARARRSIAQARLLRPPVLNVETRVVDNAMRDVRARRDRRDRPSLAASDDRLLQGRARRPRRFAAAGSTRAISRRSTTRATSASSTARRT